MRNLYICNAFSLSMLDRESQLSAPRTPSPVDTPERLVHLLNHVSPDAKIVSVVGHVDTANLFSKILNYNVKPNRISITLEHPDDHALVGQYIGPRLPEGATTLPEGARIDWWLI